MEREDLPMFVLPPTTIHTPRLRLRPLEPDDAPALYAFWRLPEVMEHMAFEPLRSPAQAAAVVDFFIHLPEKQEGSRFAIVERTSAQLIGTCGFHEASVKHRRVELGYELSPEAQGKGFMTEALQHILPWCFDVMMAHRVEAFVHPFNDRSTRVLERIGFTREGTLRGYFQARGQAHDEVVWSMLSTDPRPFAIANRSAGM